MFKNIHSYINHVIFCFQHKQMPMGYYQYLITASISESFKKFYKNYSYKK